MRISCIFNELNESGRQILESFSRSKKRFRVLAAENRCQNLLFLVIENMVSAAGIEPELF